MNLCKRLMSVAALGCVWVTSVPLFGQSENVQTFTLDNGARVLYQVQAEMSSFDSNLNLSYRNTIERTLRDSGRAWLGFEIHIERTGRKDLFRVSMEPISGWPFFAAPPVPREIHSGDRVMLDVMEQPSTGLKIFDTFQVGEANTPLLPMPEASHAIAQIPKESMNIRLDLPILRSDKEHPLFAENSASGKVVAMTLSGVGRFIFTSQPTPGFRMEAVAERRELKFLGGSESYQIESHEPILDRQGAWYLWVKFEPAIPSGPAPGPKDKNRRLTLEVLSGR